MKNWMNPEIVAINLEATANQPSAEVACDDLINGVFTFGKRESGPSDQIIYTPTDGK